MVFQRKKVSPIDRRLKDLHRELTRVGQDLKTVTKSGRSMPLVILTPTPPEAVPTTATPPAPVLDGMAGKEPSGGDLFAHAAHTEASTKPVDYFPGLSTKSTSAVRSMAPAEPHDPRSGREKFAHYFMAGHFHNLRPSRQENRVVRNKAILMLIAVAALLAWLLYFLRSH